ncbi:MAG: hypothetical protein NT106_13600 [Candidatus Sumerlaeota bacterium]|nr:hypothetical protein [Candidatus Sumerlaeota bacterium]
MHTNLLRGLCIFLGVVVILSLGVMVYISHQVWSRLTPAQRMEYKEWHEKKIKITPQGIESPAFTAETIESAKVFDDIFEKDRYKFMKFSSQIDLWYVDRQTTNTAALDALFAKLPEVEPFISAFERLVNQPDYEFDAIIVAPGDLPGPYTTDIFLKGIVAKMIQIKALSLAREGRFKEAFKSAETVVKSSIMQRYIPLMGRLWGIVMRNRGVEIWREAVRSCNDTVLLRRTLERQRELSSWDGYIVEGESLIVSNDIGLIREIARYGVIANIGDMTGYEIHVEANRLEAEYLEKYVLPTCRNGSRVWIMSRISYLKDDIKMPGFLRIMCKVAPSLRSLIIFFIEMPNYKEVYARSQVAKARYDLLMLETERRICELERGVQHGFITGGTSLKDVFADDGRPYGVKPVPYSVGPDGIDQDTRILYDPTNGTFSAGDIFFK